MGAPHKPTNTTVLTKHVCFKGWKKQMPKTSFEAQLTLALGTIEEESKKPNVLKTLGEANGWRYLYSVFCAWQVPCIPSQQDTTVLRALWRKKAHIFPAHLCPHYAHPPRVVGQTRDKLMGQRPRSGCQLCTSYHGNLGMSHLSLPQPLLYAYLPAGFSALQPEEQM